MASSPSPNLVASYPFRERFTLLIFRALTPEEQAAVDALVALPPDGVPPEEHREVIEWLILSKILQVGLFAVSALEKKGG